MRTIPSLLSIGLLGANSLMIVGAELPAMAQQATGGLTEVRKNFGNQSTFSYNMTAETEAVLKLKSGSRVTNKFGDDSGNASAVFTATPSGGNVDLKGITGENILLIDDGTTFRSALKTGDNPDPTVTSSGNASAYATHTSSVTVEKGNSGYENYFQQTF